MLAVACCGHVGDDGDEELPASMSGSTTIVVPASTNGQANEPFTRPRRRNSRNPH
jgi:hypothetical protein